MASRLGYSLPPAFKRLVVVGIVLPLALAFGLGGVFCWQVAHLITVDGRVQKCDQVIQTITDIQKQMVDMETGLRAYVMTGEETFLDPYRKADAQLDGKFRALGQLTTDDPIQSKTTAYLELKARQWRFYAKGVVANVKKGDPTAHSVQMTTQGKAAMDFIREVIDKITNLEMNKRDAELRASHHATVLVVTTSIVLCVVGGILLALVSSRLLFATAATYSSALRRAEEREEEKTQWLASERAARSNAEHANRMKDEFLATLSHELRTPLNAILGWAHLLRRQQGENSELGGGLETIERNARVQTQLIDDLLDMSRIVSGKLRLDVQRISPITFIETAIETIAPAAEAKGIRIEKVLDPLAGPISGDQGRLQQVMWNLLSNAVKFTPKQGKIQVVLERVNSHVEIIVADTGVGIESEFLPFVFDKFRQADASSTRRFGGLGLGLSIVKQLVELHGGTVRVKSPGMGKGTTFTVDLPVVVAHGDDTARVHPSALASAKAEMKPQVLAGTKLLVVDDEPDARLLIKQLLEESGAEVLVASSASEGLEILEQETPDALLSDIGMPDMDGYEFIRKVRAMSQAKGKSIPAIALTAFARSEDRTRSLLAGYQVHLSKPVEPAELLATVASATGRNFDDEAK